MKKFTFKKHSPVGRFRAFENEWYNIKYRKICCGTISKLDLTRYGRIDTTGNDGKWEVRLMVSQEPTMQDPAPFKHISFTKKFDSVELAKEFINNSKKMQEIDLYLMKD